MPPAARQPARSGARGSYANGERRRAEIVDAALKVFAEKGFRRLSLRQIAEEIGTNHVALQYHFGSKDALLEAVIAHREDVDGPWRERVLREKGLFEGVPEVMRRNASMRGVIQLDATLQAEAVAPDHPAHEFIRRREETFRNGVLEMLQLEKGRGHVRDDVDLLTVARQLTALIEGLQVQWLYDESVDMAADLAAFLNFVRVP